VAPPTGAPSRGVDEAQACSCIRWRRQQQSIMARFQSAATNPHRSSSSVSLSSTRVSRQKKCFCTSRSLLYLLPLAALIIVNVSFRPLHPFITEVSLSTDLPSPHTTTQKLNNIVKVPSPTKTAHPNVPAPIPLRTSNATSSSPLDRAIEQRHQCLTYIRKRQTELLGPFFQIHNDFLLVDPAYHGNVGDHMLTTAEQVFLQNYTKDWQECDYIQANEKAPRCESVIVGAKSNALAVWHAGGNWGDLWRIAQTKRLASFRPLLSNNYTFLSMPQSLYYQNNNTQQQDTHLIQKEIENGILWGNSKERVIFTWREEYSYQRAQELYPYVTNLIVPDIAFQLGPYERSNPASVDILVFLRHDLESMLREERTISYIQDKLHHTNMTFAMVDWPDRLKLFNSEDILFTHTSIQLLSMGKVVIADRLHASILAYLMGIPFVYLDQSTNKLTKTLSVAFDSWDGCHDHETSLWSKATSLDEALKKAMDLIERYRL